MFEECTSLGVIQENFLADIKIARYQVFFWMFRKSGVTGLGANILDKCEQYEEESCYGMFQECSRLSDISKLTIKGTLGRCSHKVMFMKCTGLQDAESLGLESTELKFQCYMSMFYGCSSLRFPPKLPARILEDECYREMFYGCRGLLDIPPAFRRHLIPHGGEPEPPYFKRIGMQSCLDMFVESSVLISNVLVDGDGWRYDSLFGYTLENVPIGVY